MATDSNHKSARCSVTSVSKNKKFNSLNSLESSLTYFNLVLKYYQLILSSNNLVKYRDVILSSNNLVKHKNVILSSNNLVKYRDTA